MASHKLLVYCQINNCCHQLNLKDTPSVIAHLRNHGMCTSAGILKVLCPKCSTILFKISHMEADRLKMNLLRGWNHVVNINNECTGQDNTYSTIVYFTFIQDHK